MNDLISCHIIISRTAKISLHLHTRIESYLYCFILSVIKLSNVLLRIIFLVNLLRENHVIFPNSSKKIFFKEYSVVLRHPVCISNFADFYLDKII